MAENTNDDNQEENKKEGPKNPKAAEKKNILMAMSGGVDSSVAAFLLKRQGHNVVGVAMVLFDQNLEVPESPDFSESCSVKDLKAVRDICDHLDIPFYAINAQQEFTDLVLDPMVAQGLGGEAFVPCVHCNVVKVKILLAKALGLNMDYVATGHYAKLMENIYTHSVTLQASSDKTFDQSYLLAKLTQEELKKLILPLGDLRKTEVVKIAERFQIPYVKKKKDDNELCFQDPLGRKLFIQRRSPAKLRQEGHILKESTFDPVGEHLGVYQFYLGQDHINSTLQSDVIDKELKVVRIDSYNKKVYLGPEVKKSTGCMITGLNFASGFDLSRPQSFYVQSKLNSPKVSAKIFFKNNECAVVEFSDPIENLQAGHILAVYDRPELKAKLLASGIVSYAEDMTPWKKTDEYYAAKEKSDKRNQKGDEASDKRKKNRKEFGF